MATKKTAAKKTTDLARWDEKFIGYAKTAKEKVKNIGSAVASIKFGRGTLTVNGNTIKDGRAELVVLGTCALNAYYIGEYDADNLTPPDCYAFADEFGDESMAPHKDSAHPQSKTCAECKWNEFGTANKGKGKACANKIRLAVVLASDLEDAESAKSAEIATGTISPTNTKYWGAHVKEVVDDHGRPPEFVVSEVQTYDDPKTQIRVEWKWVENIDDGEVLDALEQRASKVQEILQQPFQAAAEKPASKSKVGGSKKFAGKGARR